MRKMANVPDPKSEFRRVVIYDAEDGTGVFVFLYHTSNDGPCDADHWYESLSLAEEVFQTHWGITRDQWQRIDDPLPGCPHDVIR